MAKIITPIPHPISTSWVVPLPKFPARLVSGKNDKEKETPKGGVKRVGYVLWNYAGRLVGANVLFLLCCIPIVTIPAALSALNRYLSAIYRVGYGFSLEDYWKEFKSDILKNLPAGVLTILSFHSNTIMRNVFFRIPPRQGLT